MRSEIPQLEVVTAIGDAELEDYVSQLLFTQGWSIIFRAFDGEALAEFLEVRTNMLRTVVVYTTDLPRISSDLVEKYASTATTFINLDGIGVTAHEIMQKVRGQLRLPLVQHEASTTASTTTYPKIEASPRKVIVVTGTSGAPGKTLFALAAAEEISQERKTVLVDADFRAIPIENYYPAKNFAIRRLDPEERPARLSEEESNVITIVDTGVLPPLKEVVNDRRWQANLYNSAIESATHLVYVANSTKSSLMQLDQFKRDLPILIKKIPITYVLVTNNGSRALRQAQAAFEKITAGEETLVIRDSQLQHTGSEGRGIFDQVLSFGSKGKSQIGIGSIATSLF